MADNNNRRAARTLLSMRSTNPNINNRNNNNNNSNNSNSNNNNVGQGALNLMALRGNRNNNNNVAQGAANLMALRGNNRVSRNSNRNNRSANGNNNVNRGAANLMGLRGAQNWNSNSNYNNSSSNSNYNNNNSSSSNSNYNSSSNSNYNSSSNSNNNNFRSATEILGSMRQPKEKQDGGEFPPPAAIPPLKRQNGYVPESPVPAGILENADAGPGAAPLEGRLLKDSQRKLAFEPRQTRKRGGRKTRRSRR